MTSHLINWAHEAGRIALSHFGHIQAHIKPDNTYVTQADLEIEQFLAKQIRAMYPDHALITEESTPPQIQPGAVNTWAIDPIDGTTAFVQGLPGWGISIGHLREGRPYLGCFYMPLLDDMTYTVTPDEVYCNGSPLSRVLRREWGKKSFLAITASAHFDFNIEVEHTRALGSIGANLVYTARGAATAAFIPKARIWDLAAGAAILAGAGGELRYLSGQPIDYAQLLAGQLAPEPIIAGHPNVLDELETFIQPLGLL